MKVYIFGSCSGTEPMPARHHCAFAVEVNEKLYWFDAGETCSYTAHMMGVDLLHVSNIFISHTHLDHVGGLVNLLGTMRKLCVRGKCNTAYGELNLYIPNRDTFDGAMMILRATEGRFSAPFGLNVYPVQDGVLFDDGVLKVTAFHNMHLGVPKDGVWTSFAFRIEAEGKSFLFSGDIKSFADLTDALGEGCDVLMTETGHNPPEVLCQAAVDCGKRIGQLWFIHHGRVILGDYEGSLRNAHEIFGENVRFLNDCDVLEI